MAKPYICARCKRKTEAALYIRLAVNRCGMRQVRRLRIHKAFPIGHFCLECGSALLQSLTGRSPDPLLPHASAFKGRRGKSVCKQISDPSLNELAGSSMEQSAGNAAVRPATRTADRATSLNSIVLPAGGEKTVLPRADCARGRTGSGGLKQPTKVRAPFAASWRSPSEQKFPFT